jgi:hypothetical protein
VTNNRTPEKQLRRPHDPPIGEPTPATPAAAIANFVPRDPVLSSEERNRLAGMVEAYASEAGLGAALDALWQEQRAIGFILGNPSEGENLNDASQFLSKKLGRYWLVHSPARRHRSDVEYLKTHGILARDPRFVYERLDGESYFHYPTKQDGFSHPCFLCSARMANPNEVLVAAVLGDSEFVYGANFAALGHCHFTVWTRVPILQKYQPKHTLLWLREHGRRLASSAYRTFFNGLGAGNSIRHYHYQTLKEDFPIFHAAPRREFERSRITRLDWPMPAYKFTAVPALNGSSEPAGMDRLIGRWLSMRPFHTLNLVHTVDADKKEHLIFVPRVDCPGSRRPAGVSNDFAGCEVAGRINIEDREEWQRLGTQPEECISDLLGSLAPGDDLVADLEAVLS